eukprot:2853583-Rhodomonas_salina.1
MPAKRGASARFEWEEFTESQLQRLPDGLHRTNFLSEAGLFRSALDLVSDGTTPEEAMARVRANFNIPQCPTRSPVHCAEHFLTTFHAGAPADDPIRQRITAKRQISCFAMA